VKTKSRLLRLAVVPLSAAVVAALAIPGSASAAAKPSVAVSHVAVQAPAGAILVAMTYVPPKTAAGAVRPDNTVYGNCGSSWFALGNLSAGQARASYGFDIDEPAIAYAAYATVAGTHIVVDNTQTGTLADRDSWDGGFTATVGDGYAFGYVELIAYLADNKGTCVSDGPSGSAIVT
jgi:hypothetical protein